MMGLLGEAVVLFLAAVGAGFALFVLCMIALSIWASRDDQ